MKTILIHTIDLLFQNRKQCIACYLIDTNQGLILIDPGPYSTIDHLKNGIEKLGKKIEDVKHIILTHIHFDHAGASWYFAHQGSQIYVHPFGLPHLEKPEKLYQSAKRIYGDRMEALWGAMCPIDRSCLVEIEDRSELKIDDCSFIAYHTPGHANHHIMWKLDNILFTGDIMGVKIDNGPPIPPCPPPEFHLEKWFDSLDLVVQLQCEEIYLTHFGKHNYQRQHITQLKNTLLDFVKYIENQYDRGKKIEDIFTLFREFTICNIKKNVMDKELQKKYETSNPADMSLMGIYRYIKKKQENE